MTITVKHDTHEYEVVVNGVECDFCQTLEHPDLIHHVADVYVCEGCWEHYN